MSKQILIPDIGGDEVSVTEIMVAVGDKIEIDQSILVVEGDKASMEVPAPEAGVIKEILVNTGDLVSTGTPMLVIVAESEAKVATAVNDAKVSTKEETTPSATATESTQQINIPDIGGDEVTVTEIFVNVGDKIESEQSVILVEGDKASMEVPSPTAGTIKEILVKIGDTVVTGKPMIMLSTMSSTSVSTSAPQSNTVAAQPDNLEKSAQAKASTTTPTTINNKTVDVEQSAKFAHATPVIRRLAREFGINLDKIKATGPKNRILKADVQNYVKDLVNKTSSNATGDMSGLGILPWPKVDFSKFGIVEQVELSKIKKISGANLHRNWVMIPHITIFEKTDITELEQYRKDQNTIAEKGQLGYKITPLVFIIKAIAKGLIAFPNMNSSISEDGQKLTLKKYYNVGIAVDTPNGLVVPVIKDVDKKGFIELAQELVGTSKKARDGKLTAADMQGGCFTITSLGGFGSIGFNPIVNAPEVGILGVSKSSMEPVWNGKEFVPRLMLPLSVAVDHRVIDGVEATKFLVYVKNLLSDIRGLLL